jgi:hypothetical protein
LFAICEAARRASHSRPSVFQQSRPPLRRGWH